MIQVAHSSLIEDWGIKMPKLNSQVFKMIAVVFFLASCASGNKKNSNTGFASRSSGMGQIKSPLSSEKSLIQELTGKKVSTLPTQEELKNKPLSTQHYYAGLRAAESQNYIIAIKHFNTVLKKYPRSSEVKSAFTAKAKVYKEMGLNEPASLNMRMAQVSSQKTKLKALPKKMTAGSSTGKTTSK